MLGDHVRRLHPPDRLPLPAQLPDRLDVTSSASIIWIWLVLWGAAFVVREDEEIRFDLIYGSVGRDGAPRRWPSSRRSALIALYGLSLPAVVDYVTFMKVAEDGLSARSASTGCSRSTSSSPSPSIVRYLWLGWQALRGEAPEAPDPDQGGSGV